MIEVKDLCVRAGNFMVSGISFEVATGNYAVLMGRTGSGKTTILEAICGLKQVERGSIKLMGREVIHLRPGERGIGFVPQDLALFSTMTVYEHLAFSLGIRKWSRSNIETRVKELADWLSLTELLSRKPLGLSGGEKQRVALGRALAFNPSVLCLDEPLSALDDDTREEMYDVFKTVRERTGVTTLHITHNVKETEKLADHIFYIDKLLV